MLTKRQIEILLSLVNTNEPVSAEWIAKKLGLSDRTIRNEFKLIQQKSNSFGISVKSIRGKGYQLETFDHDLFNKKLSKLWKKEQKVDFFEQINRVIYMLKRFLMERDFIKLESFEDEMYVSKTTIQNDLKLVRDILKKYNLELVNRPYYGTRVEGDEYMKRLCMSSYILNRNNDLSVEGFSFQVADKDLYEKILEILITKVNEFQMEMSDISVMNLATHITIACKRIKEGFVIEKTNNQLQSKYLFEKVVAYEIIRKVESLVGLNFPDSEIEYIIVHLLGTKLLQKEELTEYSDFDEVGSIVDCMLERLLTELQWDFRGDKEFIQALTLHIRPAMNRLRFGLNIRNPFLNEIKRKYPTAFDGAVTASKCIKEYLSMDVDEHEIAYIAIHISVAMERMKTIDKTVKRVIIVCSSGIGSAKLLYYRLKNIFKQELEIVDSISYYKLSDYNLSSIDFIISTIPINRDFRVPVQVINTFLEEEDIQNIQKHIIRHQEKDQSFLDHSRIFIHEDLGSKQAVIEFMCQELYKQGLVPKDYQFLVLERETLAPTSFGNLVAIPHPLTPVTDETFWTVCTLKRPIHWHQNQMVQFVCLLNVKKDSQGDLDQMYKKLIAVIENKAIVQKIIKSQSVNEIIDILK